LQKAQLLLFKIPTYWYETRLLGNAILYFD
jgi:hypothetical protein